MDRTQPDAYDKFAAALGVVYSVLGFASGVAAVWFVWTHWPIW
jgi:hypothetical protein